MEAALVTLFRHHLWANETLFAFVAGQAGEALSARAQGGYGTVQETVHHIVANEESYLASLQGEWPEDPLFGYAAPPAMDELLRRVRLTGDQCISFAASLAPAARITGTWQGHPYDMPASIPLLQVINHGTEHRGHIRSALSANGFVPPEIDLWHFHGALEG